MPYTFPSIALPDLGITEVREDPTIRSPFEAGYEQTRPRFTRRRRTWRIAWEEAPLSVTDYGALMAFVETVKIGADLFSWTHPFTHDSLTVRIIEMSEFRLIAEGGGIPGYTGSLTLREV